MITNRNFLAMVSIMISSFLSSAQTDQGYFLIAGHSNLNFSQSNQSWKSNVSQGNGTQTTNIDFSPEFGYFFRDNLATGVNLPLTHSKVKNDYSGTTTNNSLSISPFVRYYIGYSFIRPYVHVETGLGKMSEKYDPSLNSFSIPYEYSYRLFNYQAGSGIGLFINEMLSLDLGIRYAVSSKQKTKDNPTDYQTITKKINLQLGFMISL